MCKTRWIALRDVERCNASEIVETKISWSKRDKWTRFSNERSGIALETRNDETIVVPKESAATRKQRGWRERFNFSVIARQVWRVPDSTLSTRRPRSIRSRVGPRPSKPTFRGVAIFLRMFPHTLPSFHPLFSPSDFFPLLLSLSSFPPSSLTSESPYTNDSEVVRIRASILIERDNYQGSTITLFIDCIIEYESSLLSDKFF